jgi:SAM-dependent methyltransferase
MDRAAHWQDVYASKQPGQVSWYAPRLERSLSLISGVASPDAAVIDVGGGASTLVDDLLRLGFHDVTVLDVSEAALQASQRRLGAAAERVHWIVSDVLAARLPRRFDLWHDRAVFHFLTDPADRATYAALARASVVPGGHLVMATFAPDGPSRCSGLDVARYDGAMIAGELAGFELVEESREAHVTPWGAEQRFAYFLLCRSRA